MGKKTKSKNKRGPSGGPSGPASAPGSRPPQEEETLDNLRFEDPFEDEFADDDMEVVDAAPNSGDGPGGGNRDAGTTVSNDTVGGRDADAAQKKAWMPGTEVRSSEERSDDLRSNYPA